MSDRLQSRVRAFLLAQGLLRPEALLLVAVSGGPDSLCLLHVLRQLRDAGGPALHVAHLEHGVRGDQSRAEATAVAAVAAAWDLPATAAHRDVPALARASGEGLMAAARLARYTFLAETALAIGAGAVVVAHQADDQAETVLLHALRGAGTAGLRGMREVVPWGEWAGGMQNAKCKMQNGPDGGELGGEAPIPRCGALLIRPLLMTSRAEIAAYCAEHRLAPAEDPSNSAPRYARARVRRMLPALAAENPRVVAALGRTARVCADDYDFIQSQLDAVWPALAAEVAGAITLRRGVWQEQHPALQRYAVRRAAERLGATELSLAQVEAVRATATHQGRALRLGRTLRVEVDHTGMHLVRAGSAWHADGPQLPGEALPLAVGATALGAGWSCVVSDEAPAAPGRWWTALDADALDGPLELRRRRPGDRFRPAGGPGSRKLQDFFVDRKVPRGSRDAWPILATPDAIVWVAGLRADARFIAGPATRRTRWVGFVRDNDAPTDG